MGELRGDYFKPDDDTAQKLRPLRASHYDITPDPEEAEMGTTDKIMHGVSPRSPIVATISTAV
jgi:hypothetical protein